MARNNAWTTADAGILLNERPYCAFRSLVPLATRSPLISFIRAYPCLSVVIRGYPWFTSREAGWVTTVRVGLEVHDNERRIRRPRARQHP